MRCIMDSRETVCEFRHHKQTYRLILPYGRSHFSLDILVRDEYRSWIYMWEPYGYGTYQGSHVSSALTTEGHAVELGLLSAINEAIGLFLSSSGFRTPSAS